MYQKYFVLLLFACGIGLVNTSRVSFITKCKLNDFKCIKESTQSAIPVFATGIPELGVEQLDPFYFKSMDASSSGLSLHLKEVTGTGLKGCVAKKVERDIVNSKLFMKLLCTVDVTGKYEMKGRILVLPIEGKGDAHVVLRKLQISTEVGYDEFVGKDGVKHWKIKNWNHSYELKDKSTIELENLFNGNEVLSRAVRELIQSSSNEVVSEVGPPIVKAVVSKIIKSLKRFFENVPSEDLLL